MRQILFTLMFTLQLSGCASQSPTAADVATLTAEFNATNVTVDKDCIYSAPAYDKFIANRLFGLCIFSDTQLNLYYGGAKPSLAFGWRIGAIKAYAFHTDTFTVVTDEGNFGLVVKDADRLIKALRAQGVPENVKLPVFRTNDETLFHWML
jgi:hypothetical protein